MFNKRCVFVLVLLIFAITALSTVSASDFNATDEVVGDEASIDGELGQTEDVTLEEGSDGTFTQLNQIISQSSKTVTLDKNYSYTSSSDGSFYEGIRIDKNLTIYGNNNTIFGNGARVFVIAGDAKVTIKDVKFVNSKDAAVHMTNGGTISNYGDLTLKNCNLWYSTAQNRGGAIYSTRSLVVDGCYFLRNEVKSNNIPAGGAIFAYGSLIVKNSNFVYCNANCGGAIYTTNNATIINSYFLSNSAVTVGGAIFNDESTYCLVEKSEFVSNSAMYGGALYSCLSNGNLFIESYASQHKGNNMWKGSLVDYDGDYSAEDYAELGQCYYTVKLTPSKSTITYGEKLTVKVTKTLDGTPISGINVKVKIKTGSTYKTLSAKTNANGIASFAVNVPSGTYSGVSITSDQNNTIFAGSNTMKLIVKKDTVKITASAKQFKVKATKKYTITVKGSKSGVVKNTNVKMKVNRKTYTAKTNTKGQATFNFNKLNKKGSFPSTITFAGNGYYNKVTKSVKITVK